jgi:hypothetical protein
MARGRIETEDGALRKGEMKKCLNLKELESVKGKSYRKSPKQDFGVSSKVQSETNKRREEKSYEDQNRK